MFETFNTPAMYVAIQAVLSLYDSGHFLPVSLGIERCLCEEDWVLLGCNTELVVEGVMPNLLHVIPVSHNPVLDRILESQDSSLALGLIPHIGILLSHANHHTLVTGTS